MAAIDLDAAASPFDLPEVWDQVTVAGIKWGPSRRVEVRGAKRAYKWDVKDGMGQQGALETYRGQTPPPFSITFYIWTSAQYAEWLSFQKLFQYNGFKFNPKPVTIYHPSLDNLGITQVICEDIGAITKVSDDLLFSVEVSLREFFNPLPVSPVTPDAASNGDPADDFTSPEVKKLQAEVGTALTAFQNAYATPEKNPQVLPKHKGPFAP